LVSSSVYAESKALPLSSLGLSSTERYKTLSSDPFLGFPPGRIRKSHEGPAWDTNPASNYQLEQAQAAELLRNMAVGAVQQSRERQWK
jgi:hypothetical protein